MSVSALEVKKLRAQTGAGMMDCKRALETAVGDFEKAVEILREKGLASLTKRANRVTAEGLVAALVHEDGRRGVMVEIDCETDFVAKGDVFASLAADVADKIFAAETGQIEGPLGEEIYTLVENAAIEIREKLAFRKAAYFATDQGVVHAYLHKTGGWARKGVLIELAGDLDVETLQKLGHELALHVQFACPDYLTAEEVPEEVLESERRLAQAKALNDGKPEKIIPRIVEGAVQKYLKERVLTRQFFVKDDKKTVEKWLAQESGGKASIVRYSRFEVGQETGQIDNGAVV